MEDEKALNKFLCGSVIKDVELAKGLRINLENGDCIKITSEDGKLSIKVMTHKLKEMNS